MTAEEAALLVYRITKKTPRVLQTNFMGSGWWLFTDYNSCSYWLHVVTETLLESSGNRGR